MAAWHLPLGGSTVGALASLLVGHLSVSAMTLYILSLEDVRPRL